MFKGQDVEIRGQWRDLRRGTVMELRWQWCSFGDLTGEQVYAVLRLRQEVFVVEQRCAYLDADGRDTHSLHLLGWDATGGLAAYLRIVEPGHRFAEPSIGRVITRASDRGRGWGTLLMQEGIRHCREIYPGLPIKISAQHYLEKFYNNLGFLTEGEGNPYDEDGIPHIEMILGA